MQAAGFVLVGGRSTRMGQDKALLPSGLSLLVKQLAAHVREAAGSVALIGEPARYRHLGFECLTDLRPDLGPLGGIEAALASRRGDLNLILACDMPSIDTELLCNLLRRAEETEALCVVCRDRTGAVHPLCAVYRGACLTAVRRALDHGCLRLMDLVDTLCASHFDVAETISNVNTPEEWSAWQKRQFSIEGTSTALANGN